MLIINSKGYHETINESCWTDPNHWASSNCLWCELVGYWICTTRSTLSSSYLYWSPPEDRAEGKQVTIEDCAAVTHQVGGVLDLHDPIAGEYLLEVSSPGLDRAFFSAEQLHDYVGQTLSLRLIHAIGQGSDKRRKVTGELVNIDEHQLTVKTENDQGNDQLLAIELDNIDKANLVYQF